MKVTLQMDKITLSVNGREMTFSKEELSSILKEYYQIKGTGSKRETIQTAQTLTESKWFEVNPSAIDQNLFKEKRSDSRQEETRQLILEAFEELKKHPERNEAFKTLIPEKTWECKTIGELKKMATQLGDHIADWVEQSLEWAQRIANGESWEAICNEEDTANWYRLVVWKNGYTRLVGGSRLDNTLVPASGVYNYDYVVNGYISNTVPLVVLKK